MRTLAKPLKAPKEKETTPKKPNNKSQKKPSKTVFTDPFRYKVQILAHEDNDALKEKLVGYFKALRETMPIKVPKIHNRMYISLDSTKQVKGLAPLNHEKLQIGIKENTRAAKKGNIKLLIICYSQKNHDRLEELLCIMLATKIPYVVIRQDSELAQVLGVRVVSAIGLLDAQISSSLQMYCARCLVEIPWLIKQFTLPWSKNEQNE